MLEGQGFSLNFEGVTSALTCEDVAWFSWNCEILTLFFVLFLKFEKSERDICEVYLQRTILLRIIR
jgi:hypothetical protein